MTFNIILISSPLFKRLYYVREDYIEQENQRFYDLFFVRPNLTDLVASYMTLYIIFIDFPLF